MLTFPEIQSKLARQTVLTVCTGTRFTCGITRQALITRFYCDTCRASVFTHWISNVKLLNTIAWGAYWRQTCTSFAVRWAIYTVNVLHNSYLGWALCKTFVHIEKLLGQDLHTRITYLSGLGTSCAWRFALVTGERSFVLKLNTHSALFDTRITLQVSSFITLCALGASISAL